MTLAHYGKRRRGTAGSSRQQRRVSEKPYWEEIKEDEDPKEIVGGKSDSTSTASPSKKSPKKRAQILETKSPSVSALNRRSRRRKRPRAEEESASEPAVQSLTRLENLAMNFNSGSQLSLKPRSPSKQSVARSSKIATLNSETFENEEQKDSPAEIQNESPPKLKLPETQVPEESSSGQKEDGNRIPQASHESTPNLFQQVLDQIPRLENMLSGIHAALKLQSPSSQPTEGIVAVVGSPEAALEMSSTAQARQEESILRLEALCERQSKAFEELVKKTTIMKVNYENERKALYKEVESLKAAAKAFGDHQSNNNVLEKKLTTIEASMSERHEEQQIFSNQLLEIASNSKKQDIFMLERNVKIQEWMETSNKEKAKYEVKIEELTADLAKSEAKVQALESENQEFKSMLNSFEASISPKKAADPKSPTSSPQAHTTAVDAKKQSKSAACGASGGAAPAKPATSVATKRQTRSVKSNTVRLNLAHANIIELPSSPFKAQQQQRQRQQEQQQEQLKGHPPSKTRSSPSPSRTMSSPSSRTISSPSRGGRSKKLMASSTNSVSSNSTGKRRRYTKVPIPTFDSLSGLQGLQGSDDVICVDTP
ncbi:MAG: hypothetical protein SGBAC_007556 [Bacillariaceae sp.]